MPTGGAVGARRKGSGMEPTLGSEVTPACYCLNPIVPCLLLPETVCVFVCNPACYCLTP